MIKLAQEKARDVIRARKVVSSLDIPQSLKDEIIFILNKEAGEIFEGVGVAMNHIIRRNWDAGGIVSAKSSQREFFQELMKEARALIQEKSPKALSSLESFMKGLPNEPLGLNNYQLLDMANRKLQVMRAMTRN